MAECSKDGCRANALRDEALCFAHSTKPEIVKKRDAARRKGGSKGKLQLQDVDVQTIEDIRGILSETVSELRSSASENLVSKCRTVGYLCSILLTTLEKSDLEDRISMLEESLSESTT